MLSRSIMKLLRLESPPRNYLYIYIYTRTPRALKRALRSIPNPFRSFGQWRFGCKNPWPIVRGFVGYVEFQRWLLQIDSVPKMDPKGYQDAPKLYDQNLKREPRWSQNVPRTHKMEPEGVPKCCQNGPIAPKTEALSENVDSGLIFESFRDPFGSHLRSQIRRDAGNKWA